jgi:hypothetical protein
MKKYLMTGIAAVAMCAAFTSCSKDLGFEQMTQEEAMQSKYEAAFIKAFGQPSPDQDWGFGTTTRGITRGECGQCYKYDMQYDTPSFPKTGHPADITDKERTYVKWWFENNPGLSEVGMDIHNFYLQHVWGQPNKPYTVVYERGNYSENGTMDYLEVGDGTNYTHVLDFNANGPGSYGIVYMRNSSALGFGFHATWGDRRDYHNFKLAHIVGDYEGEHIDGWYVGLAMYAEKDDNGLRVMNGDKWNYADDWILKIVPGEGEEIEIPSGYDGRIMAEDLNAGEKSDFDFNDVVFDWKIEGRVATIQLLAAGGTLPLYVGDEEVHDKFGVFLNDMVNTGVKTAALPEPYTYTFPDGVAAEAINIPIVVTKGGVNATLTAEKGKVASKINVSTNTKWVKEYKDITLAYPNFTGWVSDPSANWTSNYNSDYLYNY